MAQLKGKKICKYFGYRWGMSAKFLHGSINRPGDTIAQDENIVDGMGRAASNNRIGGCRQDDVSQSMSFVSLSCPSLLANLLACS